LTWEHFQPRPDRVDTSALRKLVVALDLASRAGVRVMPTLFTGHMSGVNWIPDWALGGVEGDCRFRVVSSGAVVADGLRNWYADPAIARAQALLAAELSGALAGHPALWAWDLGNENSNCVLPPTRALARDWLFRMRDAIRGTDAAVPLTLGLHMEDLTEDRRLGPAEAAEVCDFLTMHGYPGYATWTRGPTDEELLPFLALVTRWLAGGTEVVFSELGLPTYRAGEPDADRMRAECTVTLVEEQDAAAYIDRALVALQRCGSSAAMLWCHSDYVRSAWAAPPLDRAIHERFFGQWRADRSQKPALDVVAALASRRLPRSRAPVDTSFIDIERDQFYREGDSFPGSSGQALIGSALPRLYRRYYEARRISSE
jgi:endo-1,4-beta-mannosidase